VNCIVTSPPYFQQRNYQSENQIGNEPSPEEYIASLVRVFAEAKRVLRDDGTLWVNIDDGYCNRQINGAKPKDLLGIPWMLAFALRADGWYLRSEIIWEKPNQMPENVSDRPTRSHEQFFLLSKSKDYFFDADAIREPYTEPLDRWGGQKLVANGESMIDVKIGQNRYRDRDMRPNPKGRNKRTVWSVSTGEGGMLVSSSDCHPAVYPSALIKPCILAGSPVGGIVLDPFFGSGTTGMAALELGRSCIGIDTNHDYCKLARGKCNVTPGFHFA
jgi:site-specific DNA-methyltransferase (adenine-specific)